MKKIIFFHLLLSFFLINHIGLYAQGPYITLTSGNLNFLKGDSTIKVLYNYDNFYVGELTEKEYISKSVDNLNPNRTEEWIANWQKERIEFYQPRFDSSLNKYLKKVNLSAHESNKYAKYTMMVTTKFIEPGFSAYRYSKNSNVVVELLFFETNNPYVILAKVYGNVHGYAGMISVRGMRIANAYSNLGVLLGKLILKDVYNRKK